jgi:hypothetical protein
VPGGVVYPTGESVRSYVQTAVLLPVLVALVAKVLEPGGYSNNCIEPVTLPVVDTPVMLLRFILSGGGEKVVLDGLKFFAVTAAYRLYVLLPLFILKANAELLVRPDSTDVVEFTVKEVLLVVIVNVCPDAVAKTKH